MKVISLIPARGGSKSILKKNLQRINEKSLLQITASQSLQVNQISKTYVSSDSREILDLAKSIGCEPIERPSDIASDQSSANDVVANLIDYGKLHQELDTVIVYLQPTSPFREVGLIQRGLKQYALDARPVVTVAQARSHPLKTLRIEDDGSLSNFLPEGMPISNRQELPIAFIATGSLYIFSVRDFLQTRSIPICGASPIIVSDIYTLDIDTEFDLKIAQKFGEEVEL